MVRVPCAALGILALAAPVLAEPVALTDAQMDAVTAGAATASVKLVVNGEVLVDETVTVPEGAAPIFVRLEAVERPEIEVPAVVAYLRRVTDALEGGPGGKGR